MGQAPVSHMGIYPARNTVNTCEQNRYHAPLNGTYFIVSKLICERERVQHCTNTVLLTGFNKNP